MTGTVTEWQPDDRTIAIDPFEFFPGTASKIVGLGGGAPGHDHDYVLHTAYREAAQGPGRFVLKFHNLRARRGTLWLRVHMLPLEPGAHAVLANSDRIQLNRLIQDDGLAEIRFEGFRGMSFALYVGIQGDTDAAADSVETWFDRPADPNDVPTVLSDGRTTAFGKKEAQPATHMLSAEAPSFAEPVAQIATESQIAEPAYRTLNDETALGGGPMSDWQALYVVQVLSRYGMLQSGARGVGMGVDAGDLAALFARAGTTARILASTSDLDADTDEARLSREGLLPADLIDHDFIWSVDLWSGFSGAAATLAFIERSLSALRPGGIAVHCGRYRDPAYSGTGTALSRNDVEKLLLILISRGHEVAQFKFSETDALIAEDDATMAIGLIVRKASSFA